MTQNVPAAKPAGQPDPFVDIAAELYRVADDIVSLAGSGLPKPYFALNIQPGRHGDDDLNVKAVDAVANALLGRPGYVQEMSGGRYHYGVDQTSRGPLKVAIYQGISNEFAQKNDVAAAEAELAEREAEWKKARNRLIELRGQRADDGLGYSREPESTVVTPVPADVEGHAEFSPRGDRSVRLIGRVQAELLTGARADLKPETLALVEQVEAALPSAPEVDRVVFRRQDGTEVDVTPEPDEDAAQCPGCTHAMASHDDGCCLVCHCHPGCTDGPA